MNSSLRTPNSGPPDIPIFAIKNDAAEFGDRTASFSGSLTPNVSNGDTSMNENITTATVPATITQKELWALFVELTIKRSAAAGIVLLQSDTFHHYRSRDRLHAYGEFEELSELSERVIDTVESEDDPLWTLTTIIDDIEGYAADLKIVRDDFQSVMSALEVYDDADELCYRHPAAGAPMKSLRPEGFDDTLGALEASGINISEDGTGLSELSHPVEAAANLRHLADLIELMEAA